MKRNSLWPRSAVLCVFFAIPAFAQNSVTGGNSAVPGNIEGHDPDLKAVERKLKAAAEMMRAQPPNYDQAIAILTEAAQVAPNQDEVWYRLGAAYLGAANVQADGAEKTKRSTEAYNDLQKAIDVFNQRKNQELQERSKPTCNIKGGCTHVELAREAVPDHHKLAVYYSNLGDAAAKLGTNGEAIKDFRQATQLDPAYAGTYYFDEGIILRNTAKTVEERKEAVDAFDRTTAADPTKAVAYYLKGELLLGMAATNSEGKVIPLPGTVEALQKYLELQPNGPYVDQAKSFLAALNATELH